MCNLRRPFRRLICREIRLDRTESADGFESNPVASQNVQVGFANFNVGTEIGTVTSDATTVAGLVNQIKADMVQADPNGSQNLFIQSGGAQGTPATFAAGIQGWYNGLKNPTPAQTALYNSTMSTISGPASPNLTSATAQLSSDETILAAKCWLVRDGVNKIPKLLPRR